jgi:hypothetical protein
VWAYEAEEPAMWQARGATHLLEHFKICRDAKHLNGGTRNCYDICWRPLFQTTLKTTYGSHKQAMLKLKP